MFLNGQSRFQLSAFRISAFPPTARDFTSETKNENPDSTGANGENRDRKGNLCFLRDLQFKSNKLKAMTTARTQNLIAAARVGG